MCGSRDEDHPVDNDRGPSLGGRPRGPRPRDAWRKGDAPRGTSRKDWYRRQAGEFRRLPRDLARRVLPRLT